MSYDCRPSVLSSPTSPSVATLRCSAYQVGEQLSPSQVLHAQNTWVVTADSPAAKVDKEAAASFFDKRAQLLRLESKRGSLRSVASGLKAWHGFADLVLDCPCAATLPPRTDADVCRFISVFTKTGTAADCVGYVKWACVNFNLSCAWWTDRVTLTLRGLKAEHLRPNGGPIPSNESLTDDWVAWQTAKVSYMFRRLLLRLRYFSCVFKVKL